MMFVCIPSSLVCQPLLRGEERASRPVELAWSCSVESPADRGGPTTGRVTLSPADRGLVAVGLVEVPSADRGEVAAGRVAVSPANRGKLPANLIKFTDH